MASPQRFSVNLGLPVAPTTNNSELFSELLRVYNALKIVMGAVDTYSGTEPESSEFWSQLGFSKLYAGMNSSIYIPAAEPIAYGQVVGIDGSAQAVLAQVGFEMAVGFCSAPNGVALGETCSIQIFGMYPELPAATLTPGIPYYLSSTTPGAITSAFSSQRIGFALSDRRLFFSP